MRLTLPSILRSDTTPRSSGRIWAARAVAVGADFLQIAAFPMFFGGLLSPVNAVVDVIVAVSLTVLVGWHIAFLPTFIIEQLPFADLAPTWTLAALIATRRKRGASASAVAEADR